MPVPIFDFNSAFDGINKGLQALGKGMQDAKAEAAFEAYLRRGGQQTAPPRSLADLGPTASASTPDSPQSMSLATLGKAPTFAAMEGAEPSADFKDMFGDAERQHALPTGYLSRTAAIESRFNPNAQNPSSSAGGLFQFTDGTAKQYGLSDKYDPLASTNAAARLAADNRAILSARIGREPTAGELYLAHQQGAGGASALLANPDISAVDALTAVYKGDRNKALQAVRNNGGDESMTAGQFASRWTSKVDSEADQPAPGAQNAQFVIPSQSAGSEPMPTAQTPSARGVQAPGPYRPTVTPPAVGSNQPLFSEDEIAQLKVMGRSERLRPYVNALIQERISQGTQAQQRAWESYKLQEGRQYDQWKTQDQRAHEANVLARNQDREDRIRHGTWTREDEVRHSQWAHDAEAKGTDRAAADAALTPDQKEYNFYVKQAQERGEEPQDFTTWTRGNKASGAPKTILPETEKAYDAAVGKSYGETFSKIQQSGRDSTKTLNTLKIMDSLLQKPDFYSGTGAKYVTWLNKAMTSLGYKDANFSSANEVFEALANQAVLDAAGGSLGAGIANADRDYLGTIAPGLSKTPEGNRQLIEIRRKMATREQQIAAEARRYAARNKGRIDEGFDEYLADWAQKNPLFEAVAVSTPEEADRLAPGTRFVTPDGREFTR